MRMKIRRVELLIPLVFALTAAKLSGAVDCESCLRARKEQQTHEAERRKLIELQAANRNYLNSGKRLTESVISKIQSNLLIIDLKLSTASNLIEGAKRTQSATCSGCEGAG